VGTKQLRQVDVVKMVDDYDHAAGISQPDVSRILRGNVKGYSESRLMTIVAALGNNVEIVVEPIRKGRGRISIREPTAA
jgi:predicted XRE-type DNA-binding protein